ncbi:cellulose biosynthesis protein BcsQ [Halomonas sp. GXIMD04776]|uniref:cellulose biosynthesis protein BcsQ n=1 Tax=Halomonas sp. GXIMD04776 TaxID=3415605 RepID=UPI003CBDD9A2
MIVVAVQGCRGGTGASSIVAGLAQALVQAGERVLCIDLDPHNLLRLHFNHDWHDDRGWANAVNAGQAWHTHSFALGSLLHFLPYGYGDSESSAAMQSASQGDAWSRRLRELDGDTYRWVLLDMPVTAFTRRQDDSLTDMVLTVAHADPACHALLARREFHETDYLLVNRFAPSSALQNDLYTLWQAQYSDWLLPWTIHRDEAMFEALAHKQSIIAHRPDSLAAQGVRNLASWLLARHEEAA